MITIEFHYTIFNPGKEAYAVKNDGVIVFIANNLGFNPTDKLRTVCECLRWIIWNLPKRLVSFNGREIHL